MKKPRYKAPPSLKAARKICRVLESGDPNDIAAIIERVVCPEELMETIRVLITELRICCQKLNGHGFPCIAGGREEVAMAKGYVVLNKVHQSFPWPKGLKPTGNFD